jgi:hypothetical protein
MLFRETVAVYCENHIENTNTLPNTIYKFSSYLTGNTLRLLQKPNRLMLFRGGERERERRKKWGSSKRYYTWEE